MNVIEGAGIGTERGALAASVIEVSERNIARLNEEHDSLDRASWAALLPMFRGEKGRVA